MSAAASHVLHMHDAITSVYEITSVCDHAMQFTIVHIKAQAKVGRVSQDGLL